MILSRLIDIVRFEAKLAGSYTATAFIYETILEVLKDLTAIELYQEMLVPSYQVTISAGAQTSVALPADFQHYRGDNIKYLPLGDFDSGYTLLESEYFDQTNDGIPTRYQLSGKTILLYPSAGSVIGDKVQFGYYKFITTLTDSDEFPIAALEPAVKKAVVARLIRLMGKDSTKAEGDSNQSLARSKGDGTTN